MIPKIIFCLCQSFFFVFLTISISYAQETLSKEEQVQRYYTLAVEYHFAGEYEKAIEYFTKIIEIDSSDAYIYYLRASIYGEEGKYYSAISELKKVNTLAPEFPDAYGDMGRYLLGEWEQSI